MFQSACWSNAALNVSHSISAHCTLPANATQVMLISVTLRYLSTCMSVMELYQYGVRPRPHVSGDFNLRKSNKEKSFAQETSLE